MIVCPRCGKENQDHYKFCLGCGAELPRDSSRPPSLAAPANEPRTSTDAPAAPAHAGAQSFASAPQLELETALPEAELEPEPTEDALLPPELAPLGDDTTPCSNCGAHVPQNFRFCHVCGHDLHSDAPPAAEAEGEVPEERVSAPAVSETPAVGETPDVAEAPAIAETPAAGGTLTPLATSDHRARLVLIQPDGSEGDSFPLLGDRCLIGRSAGGVFASDAYLSPEHAEFRFERDQLVVRDMESLNGVYIRIDPEVPIELFDGSVFRVGQEIIRFDAPRAPDPAPDGTQHAGSPHYGFVGRISLVIGRNSTGNSFPIPPHGIHLGRERGDVLFPEDGYVSGLHCRIHSEVGHVFLTDVGSSNGTFVRVANESFVPRGTFVLMGQQLFRAEY